MSVKAIASLDNPLQVAMDFSGIAPHGLFA